MTPRGQAIVLVGFMGSGKSTVGKSLEGMTKLPRVELDDVIAAKFGISITDIFAQFGGDRFREAETTALKNLSGEWACIVVTGGGIVTRAENIEVMHKLGIVVNLDADLATLWQRVQPIYLRPLLQTSNPRATLEEMHRLREPLYRQAADFHIDNSQLTARETARAILSRVKRWRAQNRQL